MNKQARILLVIDGHNDDRALLSELEPFVKDKRSHVDILSIEDPAPAKHDRNVAVSSLQKWETKVRSMRLSSLSSALANMGVSVAIKAVRGKSHLETIRKTIDTDYDFVMKLAAPEAGTRDIFFGGTDIQLLSLCPVPVWIVQPTENRKISKVGVAIDLAPNDKVRTELAEDILQWGVRTAASTGAELHLIHIWSLYRESTLKSWPTSAHLVDSLLKGQERLHGRWLDDAFEKLLPHDLDIHRHLVKGNARLLIPELTEELGLDLLIMGTVGRTGIPGFFIGNTADSVLRQVGSSVLALKPRDFVTPVEPVKQTSERKNPAVANDQLRQESRDR